MGIESEITVAIATYNGAAHIQECLDSAVASGCRVLVADDCSTDETLKIVEAYGPRVEVHRHSQNGGMGFNYQWLLEHCPTGLALFLNQDDVLLDRRWLRRCRPDEVTVSNGWNIDGAGTPTGLIYRRPPLRPLVHGVYRALTVTGFFRSPSQAVFPVEPALSLGGFLLDRPAGLGAEDWLCWLRLASAGVPFRLRMRPSVGYRIHDLNYSKNSGSHLASKSAVRAEMPSLVGADRRLRLSY